MKINSFSIFKWAVRLLAVALAVVVIYWIGKVVHHYLYHTEGDEWWCQVNLSNNIGYSYGDGDKHVYRMADGRILLRDLDWLFVPDDSEQPLACFSQKGKRGFVDRNTGEVVVEPQYKRAWLPSDSLAAVADWDGQVKFFDCKGNLVIADPSFVYQEDVDYQFEDGMCVMTDAKGRYGLIDRKGQWKVPAHYTEISSTDKEGYWVLTEADGMMSVADSGGRLLLPRVSRSVAVREDAIRVDDDDHTIRLFDFDGKVSVDFAYEDIGPIKYGADDDDDESLGVCRCMVYEVADGYCGLMSPEGRRVTQPLYTSVKGVGPDLYLCTIGYDASVLLNGSGQEVEQ